MEEETVGMEEETVGMEEVGATWLEPLFTWATGPCDRSSIFALEIAY
jgi:hypothetical protein